MAGSAFEGHTDPIGTPECIAGCSADRIRQFYKDNYTPDRMNLLIVGDMVRHHGICAFQLYCYCYT